MHQMPQEVPPIDPILGSTPPQEGPLQPCCLGWKCEDTAAHCGYRQEASHMARNAAGNPPVPVTCEIPQDDTDPWVTLALGSSWHLGREEQPCPSCSGQIRAISLNRAFAQIVQGKDSAERCAATKWVLTTVYPAGTTMAMVAAAAECTGAGTDKRKKVLHTLLSSPVQGSSLTVSAVLLFQGSDQSRMGCAVWEPPRGQRLGPSQPPCVPSPAQHGVGHSSDSVAK